VPCASRLALQMQYVQAIGMSAELLLNDLQSVHTLSIHGLRRVMLKVCPSLMEHLVDCLKRRQIARGNAEGGIKCLRWHPVAAFRKVESLPLAVPIFSLHTSCGSPSSWTMIPWYEGPNS